MALVNYAVGPCMKGVMARWDFPPPPEEPDPGRENFYAYANQAGKYVFQQITIRLMKLIAEWEPPESFRPEIPAIAAEIHNHPPLSLITANDILSANRKGLLWPENVPGEWGAGPYFLYPEFRNAVTWETKYYLERIQERLGPAFPAAIDKHALAMEMNGYGNLYPDDYSNYAKPFYNDLAAEVKATLGLGSVGIYLAGANDPITGVVYDAVVNDLADWASRCPNIDFLGVSWYPQGAAGGYDPNALYPQPLTAAANAVRNAGKEFIIPEIGYPSSADFGSSEENQRIFTDRLFNEFLVGIITAGTRVCNFVLVDEDFDPIYGQDTAFESMGLHSFYPPGNAKPSWTEWLEGVSG